MTPGTDPGPLAKHCSLFSLHGWPLVKNHGETAIATNVVSFRECRTNQTTAIKTNLQTDSLKVRVCDKERVMTESGRKESSKAHTNQREGIR